MGTHCGYPFHSQPGLFLFFGVLPPSVFIVLFSCNIIIIIRCRRCGVSNEYPCRYFDALAVLFTAQATPPIVSQVFEVAGLQL